MIAERMQTGKAVARPNSNFRDGRPKKFSAAGRDHAVQLLHSGMRINKASPPSFIAAGDINNRWKI